MAANVNQLSNRVTSNEFAQNSETKRGDFLTEKTAKIIIQLKQVCKERGMSPPDVLDLIEANPEFGVISLSTIRRILKDGSENEGFRYSSIRPMVRALLGIQEDSEIVDAPEQFDVEKAREYFAERQALREVVLLKASVEKELRERLEKAEVEKREELTKLSLLHDDNINRLLSMHQDRDSCQLKTIDVMERNNEFLRQSVTQLQQDLAEERESKKRLYNDLKIYIDKVRELSDDVAALKKEYNK